MGLLSGGKLTPDPQEYEESMDSAIASQEAAIRQQQTTMMEGLQQQLGYMDLSPDQEQLYLQQYQSMYDSQTTSADVNLNATRASPYHQGMLRRRSSTLALISEG